MKKIFTFLAVATLVAGCSKTDEVPSASSYTITGYSAADTRTEFGAADTQSIPFLWSVGDKVWVNGVESSALTEGGPSATFTVQGDAPSNGTAVYYNMNATDATNQITAVVPVLQKMSQSLGENGDFGYAEVSNGTFTLQHATSYLWFDVEALPANATLKSIRLHAGDAILAGSAMWNGSAFGSVIDGRSIIELEVNKSSVGGEVIAMVVLPTTIESATVTYALDINGDTKYYEQTLGEKTLAMGNTYKVSVNLASVTLADYTLRTLTFEDNHAMFAPYSFTAPAPDYMTTSEMTTINVKTWSDLIVDEDKQSYQASSFIYGYMDFTGTGAQTADTEYNWKDRGNTYLVHKELESGWGYKDFSSGGHVISNHQASMQEVIDIVDSEGGTTAPYYYQLSIPLSEGHSGENFVVGYHNSVVNITEQDMPLLEFEDGVARTIESMWVTNTTVVQYATTYGFFMSTAYGNDDYMDVEVIGYNETTKVGSKTFRLAEGSATKVNAWTKWDLSDLGKVTHLYFRMKEAQIDEGTQCYNSPMFFAYDDVAVRFE